MVVNTEPCAPQGGGGVIPLYGLYRYVLRNKVWFMEVLDILFAYVGIVSRCDP